ncbi:MAG: hypothetical protein IJX14_09060, partial [Clostridia bacterium]|nr:hypothetical protein [Clostridia bacterium]
GFACIALAALLIVTRFQLSGLKRQAPTFLYSVYIVPTILLIFYSLAAYNIIASSEAITELQKADIGNQFISQVVTNLISCAIIIPLNATYFKKRKHLFVN